MERLVKMLLPLFLHGAPGGALSPSAVSATYVGKGVNGFLCPGVWLEHCFVRFCGKKAAGGTCQGQQTKRMTEERQPVGCVAGMRNRVLKIE